MSTNKPPKRSLLHRLGEAWCLLTTGHYYVSVFESAGWFLYCLHCGHTTSGWLHERTSPKAMTSKDIADSITEIQDAELDLHGGG